MKIKQIIESSTTAGSVATVPFAMNGMQTRNPSIYGQKKVGNLFKGKKTSKPYVNSINESTELSEEELSEEDLILVPGHGKNSRGFISKASDRTDREVEMAKGDLYQSIKNAKMIFDMLGDISEEDGIEGWVQEKIIKASDYLNTVREYMEQQRFANEMTGGVIAGGMANESAKKKVNPYAVGMAQAMKSTGDKPPLKKSTIVKGHKIAKKIKGEDLEEGWKSKLAGAALAGAAALGGGGAHAGGMSLPPAGLSPAQAQESTNAQFAGQQAINQHAAQQAGKIDYRKDGPITQSSLGHKLEYGIPVNAKGDFINPNRLPNIHELPRDEIEAMSEAYQAWLKDYLSRWPSAKQQPDGTMQAIKPGLAPMYPK